MNEKLKDCIKLIIDSILLIPLKILLTLIKKDDKVFIFGDFWGKRFGDNSKYLYLYLCKNKEKYLLKKIIWITSTKEIYEELKNNKYEVYYKYSFKSFYYHLKARYHFIDQGETDILGFLSRNSLRINLWHGFPLKKIKKSCKNFKEKVNIGGWKKQYLLTCSKFGDQTLGEAFQVEKDKRIKGLYPRIDFLIKNDYPIFNKEKQYFNKIKELKNKNKRILLYLPTFRENNSLIFLGETDKNKLNNFFEFLEKNNYFLLAKVHFVEKKIGRNEIEIKNNNFINIEASTDIYPILKESDILITDYSSVYFDYLVLNKDIIFYPYDLEEYEKYDQGLLLNYDKFTPGDKVYTLDGLIENLKLKNINRDDFEIERERLYKKCFEDYSIKDTIQNIFKLKEEKNEF